MGRCSWERNDGGPPTNQPTRQPTNGTPTITTNTARCIGGKGTDTPDTMGRSKQAPTLADPWEFPDGGPWTFPEWEGPPFPEWEPIPSDGWALPEWEAEPLPEWEPIPSEVWEVIPWDN